MDYDDFTDAFWVQLGLQLVGRSSDDYLFRIFRSHYGCSPTVVMKCWDLMQTHKILPDEKGLKPIHLLWALLFLKVYPTGTPLATMTKASEKTTRKWVWAMVESIAALEMHVVSFYVYYWNLNLICLQVVLSFIY